MAWAGFPHGGVVLLALQRSSSMRNLQFLTWYTTGSMIAENNQPCNIFLPSPITAVRGSLNGKMRRGTGVCRSPTPVQRKLQVLLVGLDHLLERVTRTTPEIFKVFVRSISGKDFDLQL